ncbi:hypothetical protein KA344_17715, partial [bacterium]|nr:hypothetical protein [bacterium]
MKDPKSQVFNTKILDTNAIEIDLYDRATDSLEQITQLLHQAYATLAARGFNYVAATQTAAVTESRL